ncbi:MAG: tyrosine-type recombinase/integrase [Ruminococcus sp.]
MDKDISFRELSEIWMQYSTVGVCYTWQCTLKSIVKHLNKRLGNLKVADIKPYHIDSVIYELARNNPNTNKPASKKYLKTLVATSKRIFEFAIENEVMYRNPAKNKEKSIPKNSPTKIVEAISKEQQNLVLRVEHRVKIAAVIMMFMGLRTGEMLALEWNNVDLNNYIVYIKQRTQKIEPNRYIIVPGTKNGKNRNVSIPKNLGKWLQHQKDISQSNLVFPNKSGNINSPTEWKRAWESYQTDINYYCYCQRCKASGIIPNNKFSPQGIPKVIDRFNPHQLRHTYATLLYVSGVDVLTASQLLGHRDIKTTLSIYTHLDRKFLKLNINKFNEYIKSDMDIESI